jgi:hypothetical protein
MPMVLSSRSVTATVPTAAAGVVTAERSWLAERRRRCTLSEVWTPSRRSCGRGRPGCLDGGLAVGRAVRCVDVCPMAGRTSGVHPTGVHATGGDRVSGQTGVRCPRPRHRPSAPCWILEWGGAAGYPGLRSGFEVSLWSASGVVVATEAGRWGRDGRTVGSARLAGGSAAEVGRRLVGAEAAAPRSPPGRPGSWSSAREPVG